MNYRVKTNFDRGYVNAMDMLKSPRPAVFRSPRFTVRSTNNNQLRKRL